MGIPIHDQMSESRAGAPALVVVLLAAVSVWWLSGRVAHEDYRNVLTAVVLLQVTWVFWRWRTSVYAFMVYVIMEGFLINYFYTVPELNLLKDVFVVALFTVLAASTVPRGIFPVPKSVWFLPFLLFALLYTVQVFNPHLPNVLVGLIGLRVTLLYAVLVPVAYWFFDTRERVVRFFFFLTMVSMPVSAFGVFQYFVGPSWLVSLSPGFARAVFYASGGAGGSGGFYFRTISTFVQTGGFAIYLSFMMLIAVAQLSMATMKMWRRWITGAFALQLLAALTTGGRAPLVLFVAGAALLMTMQRKMSRLMPILALSGVVFVGSVIVLGPAVAERFATLLDLQGVKERNAPLVLGWLSGAMESEMAGLGAGYATVASRHAGVTELNGTVVENTLAKVRYEAGLPGLVLYAIFVLAMIAECIRVPMQMRDREFAWLVGACSAFILVNIFLSLPWGTPFDTSPTNVYLWFFLGLLARAPHLAEASQPVRVAEVGRAALSGKPVRS